MIWSKHQRKHKMIMMKERKTFLHECHRFPFCWIRFVLNHKYIFVLNDLREMTTNSGRSFGKFDKKKPKLDKSWYNHNNPIKILHFKATLYPTEINCMLLLIFFALSLLKYSIKNKWLVNAIDSKSAKIFDIFC